MDTTKTATHVSLCAGYGGIDLGLKRAIPSLRTIAFSEIEAFACANLVAKMEAGHLDPAPIWTDVKTFPYASFHGKVDILSGGYPCQPFSAAGKRLGADDPRHLWPFIADGVAAMRPEWCFFENVEGHISLGLPNVIEDLAGMGYRTAWGIFSASECGAPHQRKRVFILAHSKRTRLEGFNKRNPSTKPSENERADIGPSSQRCVWPSRPGEQQFGWEPPRVVADAVCNGRSKAERDAATMGDEERSEEGGKSESGPVAPSSDGGSSMGDAQGERSTTLRSEYEGFLGELCADSSNGQSESDGRQAQPSLGRNPDGPAGGLDYAQLRVACDNRTDELRLLGNGVVPATAERAFTTLLQRLLTYA